jgi:hypothetical protein
MRLQLTYRQNETYCTILFVHVLKSDVCVFFVFVCVPQATDGKESLLVPFRSPCSTCKLAQDQYLTLVHSEHRVEAHHTGHRAEVRHTGPQVVDHQTDHRGEDHQRVDWVPGQRTAVVHVRH